MAVEFPGFQFVCPLAWTLVTITCAELGRRVVQFVREKAFAAFAEIVGKDRHHKHRPSLLAPLLASTVRCFSDSCIRPVCNRGWKFPQ
jgi:hypothetical protein